MTAKESSKQVQARAQAAPQGEDALRAQILAAPERVLQDHDVMRALLAADAQALGGNVVDLRAVAMRRLEGRLDRLESTHRTTLAAAYDHIASARQIHQALLHLLEAGDLTSFLDALTGPVARGLRLDTIRLAIERADKAPPLPAHPGLALSAPGFSAECLIEGRSSLPRAVLLRQPTPLSAVLHGSKVGSEAVMLLDFGPGRLPGLLLMGMRESGYFHPSQGTDLLSFFASSAELILRRWLG